MNGRTPTDNPTAPVSGFARSFVSGYPLEGAKITIPELKDDPDQFHIRTDKNGRFGPVSLPVGEQFSLRLEKSGSWWSGYKTTQSATFTVPREGINDDNYLKNISFQVPSNMAVSILSSAMGVTEDKNKGQIAATVTPPNTTMDDIPQGVEGVQVTLSPDPGINVKSFYFGIFPIIHKTNPFVRSLQATSLDGGVMFINVPEGIYTLKAKKEGLEFSEVTVKVSKGVITNVSPPGGPTLQSEYKPDVPVKSNPFRFFKSAIATVAEYCTPAALHSIRKKM